MVPPSFYCFFCVSHGSEGVHWHFSPSLNSLQQQQQQSQPLHGSQPLLSQQSGGQQASLISILLFGFSTVLYAVIQQAHSFLQKSNDALIYNSVINHVATASGGDNSSVRQSLQLI